MLHWRHVSHALGFGRAAAGFRESMDLYRRPCRRYLFPALSLFRRWSLTLPRLRRGGDRKLRGDGRRRRGTSLLGRRASGGGEGPPRGGGGGGPPIFQAGRSRPRPGMGWGPGGG